MALIGATGVGVWFLTRAAPPRVVRFSVSPALTESLHIATNSRDIAISPDGEQIAYLTGTVGSGARQLHVRPLDQLTSEILVSDGDLNHPFFSPDGASVGYYEGGGGGSPVLKRVPVLGGPTSVICQLPGNLLGASWGADGTIVFGVRDLGLWQVAAARVSRNS